MQSINPVSRIAPLLFAIASMPTFACGGAEQAEKQCECKAAIYPAAAQRALATGTTTIQFSLESDGHVGDAVVVTSSGESFLMPQHWKRSSHVASRRQLAPRIVPPPSAMYGS
jgi:hypothetical protein